ncbi:hypothetical protein DFH08DRAFT_804340 [Mycena albidolilacea]|uniref:Uncharacterized protein n=1 Tax=Mycena albidolilacea TaxID=1033008 RepID=A0AAD7ABP6_9AGAR|nr:hypothetical protein DFH08DRAFT_804340 [Mycena albidolilacea]
MHALPRLLLRRRQRHGLQPGIAHEAPDLLNQHGRVHAAIGGRSVPPLASPCTPSCARGGPGKCPQALALRLSLLSAILIPRGLRLLGERNGDKEALTGRRDSESTEVDNLPDGNGFEHIGPSLVLLTRRPSIRALPSVGSQPQGERGGHVDVEHGPKPVAPPACIRHFRKRERGQDGAAIMPYVYAARRELLLRFLPILIPVLVLVTGRANGSSHGVATACACEADGGADIAGRKVLVASSSWYVGRQGMQAGGGGDSGPKSAIEHNEERRRPSAGNGSRGAQLVGTSEGVRTTRAPRCAKGASHACSSKGGWGPNAWGGRARSDLFANRLLRDGGEG